MIHLSHFTISLKFQSSGRFSINRLEFWRSGMHDLSNCNNNTRLQQTAPNVILKKKGNSFFSSKSVTSHLLPSIFWRLDRRVGNGQKYSWVSENLLSVFIRILSLLHKYSSKNGVRPHHYMALLIMPGFERGQNNSLLQYTH